MIQVLDSTDFGLLPVTEVDPGLLQSFQCGKPHLDLFLQVRAPLFHLERLCYAWVVVDAANEDSVTRYYERHGFLKSLWAEKQALHQGGKKPRTTIKMLRDILVPW